MSHAAAVFRGEDRRKQIRRLDFLRAGADAIYIRIDNVGIPGTTAICSGAERREKESAVLDLLRQAIVSRIWGSQAVPKQPVESRLARFRVRFRVRV